MPPRPTPRVCYSAAPATAQALALLGDSTHVVCEDFSHTAIALCFSEADAKKVAEALNNAAGRAAAVRSLE
jgi:hypothetical protein